MSVTPTPQTIRLDLTEEYLDFLEMASRQHNLSPQDIMQEALAMLKDAKLSPAALPKGILTFPAGHKSDLKKTHLAAWDRWSDSQGQQLPLPHDLAPFVDQQIAESVAKNATGVVMLALLRYAKVMDYLPTEDEEEP